MSVKRYGNGRHLAALSRRPSCGRVRRPVSVGSWYLAGPGHRKEGRLRVGRTCRAVVGTTFGRRRNSKAGVRSEGSRRPKRHVGLIMKRSTGARWGTEVSTTSGGSRGCCRQLTERIGSSARTRTWNPSV